MGTCRRDSDRSMEASAGSPSHQAPGMEPDSCRPARFSTDRLSSCHAGSSPVNGLGTRKCKEHKASQSGECA